MRFEKWQALGNDYLIVEARALPWELTAGAGRAALRPALRGRLRRHPAARAARGPGVRRRAADLQPRRLRGRALRQRRPRGDPLPAPPRLDRRGRVRDPDRRRADHADDHRSELTCTVEMGRAATTSKDFPSGGRGRQRGRSRPAGRDLGVPARLDRQPAVRDRASATSSRSSTSARSGPRSRAASCSRTAPTSPSSRSTAAGSGRGSSSAGWGRRSPPGPAPAAPP